MSLDRDTVCSIAHIRRACIHQHFLRSQVKRVKRREKKKKKEREKKEEKKREKEREREKRERKEREKHLSIFLLLV
jgi:hypothetical protein